MIGEAPIPINTYLWGLAKGWFLNIRSLGENTWD